MNVNLSEKLEDLKSTQKYWKSFVERPGLEIGVLYLRPGQEDVQNPHNSDEVYFIIEGNGFLTIDGQEHEINPNMAFVVDKGLKHKFHGNSVPIIGYYVLN